MGYSVELMGLFHELGERGQLDGIKRVVDLGSQEIHFGPMDLDSSAYKESIRQAILAFGGEGISDEQLDKLANRASTKDFYLCASKEYKALDADGWYGKPFDFNLDVVNEEEKCAYCLTVNGGTTEHLVDQNNAFKIIHDLTRSGGLMIHQVPFLGSIDHGFFNYNPNFFTALAKFNNYEILGLWVCPSGTFSLIPWNDALLKHLKVTENAELSVLLYCALRKNNDEEFCIPFQKGYETMQHPDNLKRYRYNVDGRLISGEYAVQLSEKNSMLSKVSGKKLVAELGVRIKRKIVNFRK